MGSAAHPGVVRPFDVLIEGSRPAHHERRPEQGVCQDAHVERLRSHDTPEAGSNQDQQQNSGLGEAEEVLRPRAWLDRVRRPRGAVGMRGATAHGHDPDGDLAGDSRSSCDALPGQVHTVPFHASVL